MLKKTIIPPRCEMEIMAHIHSKEIGTWLLEGFQFKELSIYVVRSISIPKEQTLPILAVNLDPLPVTLHKNKKVANAELIREEAICSTGEKEEPSKKEMSEEGLIINLQTLPSDITETQKEQFLALMSEYSDVISMSPNDLKWYNITSTLKMQHLSDNELEGSHSLGEKLYRLSYREC